MEMLPAQISKIIGPFGPEKEAAGVVILTEEKTFMIVVGLPEAQAILREIHSEEYKRPMTHDLMAAGLRGFGIEVKRVIISSLVETTFCATIVLERSPVVAEGGEALRETVMLDARASDSIVLALKFDVQLEVSRQVIKDAMDLHEQLAPAVPEDLLDQIKGLAEDEDELGADEDEPGWTPPSEEYDPEKE